MGVGVRLPCSPAPAFFLLSLLVAVFRPTSAVEFLFNGFKPSNLSLSDDAVIESTGVLKLTNDSVFTMGHAFFPFPIQTTAGNATKSILPFSTSFVFAISTLPNFNPGHGLALFFSPTLDIRSASASQNLGLFNWSSDGRPDNHIFAVEFDVFQNAEFKDPNDNHVGIDVNSLTSLNATAAGYWPDNSTDFVPLTLNSGANYQAWIDFSGGEDGRINVSMAPAGTRKPRRPLISAPLNLSAVFEDKMFVGFSSACGRLVESHRILAWGFSNSDFSIGDRIVTKGLPSFVPVSRKRSSAKLIGGISAAITVAFITATAIIGLTIRRRYLKRRSRQDMEEWEQEFWPHRVPYEDLKSATKGFKEENLLKDGANGRIYRGVLPNVGAEIVVKCINHECDEGMKGFLSEICSVGRLKHRNLVGLRGWCKRDRVFMLVYDFMKNGSLDDWIFGGDDSKNLDWRSRVKILRDVGNGVLYLHEGWEVKVLHRDIKASNVMLDQDMTGRLGDFGLARLYEHGQMAHTTRVVGTIGYMAPEVVKAGKASVKTDVFGFGMLILEVVCGRRPIEEGKPELVKWLLGLLEKGEILNALDPRLRDEPGYVDLHEADKFLRLGLVCTSENPQARPSMRQVVKVLEAEEGDQEVEGSSEELSSLVGLRSIVSWSEYGKNPVFRHPTLDQVRGSSSISVELSESDIMIEGR
ncbi:L-type lectin-domain containing receptor kinase VII.1 [Nymphaea colorata]|uniref:L-type lectin-domain containing receptor kinase VII.1 n=1 Tax=Nymphaea colorata TaxID=210225 RepID=UPI00129E1936|nr:L-type lectin-domain containing receptor kinase VII.1 [Nymphaea colorata]